MIANELLKKHPLKINENFMNFTPAQGRVRATIDKQ